MHVLVPRRLLADVDMPGQVTSSDGERLWARGPSRIWYRHVLTILLARIRVLDVPVGRSNTRKRGRPPAPAERHAELRSASGVVGAASRTRSSTGRRARTTTVTILTAAQIGTSGV